VLYGLLVRTFSGIVQQCKRVAKHSYRCLELYRTCHNVHSDAAGVVSAFINC